MNIYSQKQTWKILLLIAAACIVGVSLWYTNRLVNKIQSEEKRQLRLWAEAVQKKAKLVRFTNELFSTIKDEERKKAELYAEATKKLSGDLADIEFVFKVIQNNTTVPVILTDHKGKISATRNLDASKEKDTTYLKNMLELMQTNYKPIEIEYYRGKKNYLYYKDSKVFEDIKIVFDSLVRSFIREVTINTASVPVIYTDSSKSNILEYGNIDTNNISKDETPELIRKNELKQFLQEKIISMSELNPPLEIDLGGGRKNYIFYEDSYLLTQLKYYPYFQFGVIGLFLLIAYTLFSTARKAEQNQVWVGMSKETAHQLGTPLSSLMAWIEILKTKSVDESILKEIQRDIDRLDTITERFSKIGSKPVLVKENIIEVLNHAADYIKQRTSRNVQFEIISHSKNPIKANVSVPLFEWVIENLCKNAVDAMDGVGKITLEVTDAIQFVYVDVSDTGKGIPKSKTKTVFEPGYTTKKRGWGLGLSLCKRIIENYHGGKIFVKGTEPDKGTTFRIVLEK